MTNHEKIQKFEARTGLSIPDETISAIAFIMDELGCETPEHALGVSLSVCSTILEAIKQGSAILRHKQGEPVYRYQIRRADGSYIE